MSAIVKKRVNLELSNTGLQFEDIAVGDESKTLEEFIESTLLRLEVNYSLKTHINIYTLCNRVLSPKFI